MASNSATTRPGTTSVVFRFALTVIAVVLAMALTEVLRPVVDAEPVFFAAVILSSWFAGMAEGLLAVLLSALALQYFSATTNVGYLMVFVVSALLVSWLSAKRRRAEASLREARDRLETRVQERTADLHRANAELQEEIAERRRVEAMLREQADLLDLTHDAVMVRDMNDVITYWNRAAEKMYGIAKADALGRVSHALLQTVFPAPRQEIDAELVKRGRWEGDVIHTRPDGKEIVTEARWALQKDDQGRPLAILAINSDITERRKAEEALREMRTELARVTRVLTMGELAASIAHEINQPLAAVVTNGNACLRWLAGQTPNLDEAREASTRIIRDANRASEVITRIRALFKRTESQKARFDVTDVIRDVVAMTRDELFRNRVALQTELSALPPVDADRIQLEQVILNLVINAVEAMSPIADRSRQITIRTVKRDANEILVAVEDSGTGLDPEKMDRLFDAFFTTKPSGMGMGLSLSRTIVEAHGGRLWATANAGPGATFQFTLPVSSAPTSL